MGRLIVILITSTKDIRNIFQVEINKKKPELLIVQEATWEQLHTLVWCSSIFGKILRNSCNLAKSFSGNFRSLYWLSKTFHSGTRIGGRFKRLKPDENALILTLTNANGD